MCRNDKEARMGFDQYHEPAAELSAETRTFARIIASLTEEAEAIGWYQQRISLEPDPHRRRRSWRTRSRRSSSTSAWISSSSSAAPRSGGSRCRRSSSRTETSSKPARGRRKPKASARAVGRFLCAAQGRESPEAEEL